MRVIVVGGGPIGMFTAMALARRGDDVTVVDRDPGPSDGSSPWDRRGVMQFMHPHGFRPIVRHALLATLPDVYDALLAAGALAARPNGFPEQATSIQCRRLTYERVMWAMARREPNLTLHIGNATDVDVAGGRASGVVVDGETLPADLVIVATGRIGKLADDARPPAEGGSCGFSYVSRMYRGVDGVTVPRTGFPMIAEYDGYLALVFPQDDETLSALIVRADDDDALAHTRETALFQTAASSVPLLAPWVDPQRFEPITDALPGGNLTNTYRPHGPDPISGLLFVGDAISTTNPAAGRGVSLGVRQASTMLDLLAAESDTRVVAQRFDAWCEDNIKPWYEDHVVWDSTMLRRFHGEDIDVDGPIPSDIVCAAAPEVPEIAQVVMFYLGMVALPSILDPFRETVRTMLRDGWRPTYPDGPSRVELAQLLEREVAVAG